MSDDHSKLIRQAFETSLNIFGERIKQDVIEDLIRRGIDLHDPQLDLPQLEKALKPIMGNEGTALILKRVLKKLEELEHYRS